MALSSALKATIALLIIVVVVTVVVVVVSVVVVVITVVVVVVATVVVGIGRSAPTILGLAGVLPFILLVLIVLEDHHSFLSFCADVQHTLGLISINSVVKLIHFLHSLDFVPYPSPHASNHIGKPRHIILTLSISSGNNSGNHQS
ncbi:hypothetical protein Tco_0415379 [Tanacetum coccineum]